MGWGGGSRGNLWSTGSQSGSLRGHESPEPLLSDQKTNRPQTILMCLRFGF